MWHFRQRLYTVSLSLLMLYVGVGCDSFPPLAFSEAGVDAALGDLDRDGYRACPASLSTTEAVGLGCDCDDGSPALHPHATELCDALDNDCTGLADDGPGFYPQWWDQDGDGWGGDSTSSSCNKALPGYSQSNQDCNDFSAASFPGAEEQCDGTDNNCDDEVDEGVIQVFYRDQDQDGVGTLEAIEACTLPPGYAETSGDCDDIDSDQSPEAAEICDGKDNDCDGVVPGDETDTDSDGYALCQGDCDDTNHDISPKTLWIIDEDSDGYGDTQRSETLQSCETPLGYVLNATDCNDSNPDTHPGAVETCDGEDNDCDGSTASSESDLDHDAVRSCMGDCDDSDPFVGQGGSWYPDEDLDGFGAQNTDILNDCLQPEGFVADGSDCDDSDSTTNPSADEVCDGEDNDCDGALLSGELDQDQDSFLSCADDCDDSRADIYAGAQEVLDGVDNDCDGAVDTEDIDCQDGQCGDEPLRVTAVAAGMSFSLALDQQGRVWGWGATNEKQLGPDYSGVQFLPVPVAGLPDPGDNPVQAIAAGYAHALALMSDGTVYAWGDNNGCQLGIGIRTESSPPVRVQGLPNAADNPVVAIDTFSGGSTSLALLMDGSVWTWGCTPTQVAIQSASPENPVTAVAAGLYHYLALKKDGSVYTWGSPTCLGTGDSGYNGNIAGLPEPTANPVVAIDAGWCSSAALLRDGSVYTWGVNNIGELGTHCSESIVREAVRVDSLPSTSTNPVLAITAGSEFVVVALSDGTFKAWGNGSVGQLGNQSNLSSCNPVDVLLPEDVQQLGTSLLSGGGGHVLLAQPDGTLLAWGDNSSGQVGIGNTGTVHSPTSALPRIMPYWRHSKLTSPSGQHSLAILEDGELYAWGANSYNQLGVKACAGSIEAPARVDGLPASTLDPVLGYTTGLSESYVIMTSGRLYSSDPFTQCDDEAFSGMIERTDITSAIPEVIISISASENIYLALTSSGAAYAWGRNDYGQLGNGTRSATGVYQATPGPVIGLPDPAEDQVVDILATPFTAYALVASGEVWAWGANAAGSLGIGTSQEYSTIPVKVLGLPDPKQNPVTAIAADSGIVFALTSEGTLYAWGNEYLTTHDAPQNYFSLPVQVQGLPKPSENPVKAIAITVQFALSLLADGSVYSWGYNQYGALGDGTTVDHFQPERITIPGATFENPVISISAGSLTSFATLGDGTLWSWGDNSAGSLGLGLTLTPRRVTLLE